MKREQKGGGGLMWVIPLVFFAAAVPVVTRLICLPISEEARRQWAAVDAFAVFISRLMDPSALAAQYWPGPFETDLFTFWKAFWIVAAAALLLVMLAVKALRREIRPAPYHLPLALYAFFIVISCLLSPYREVALYGFPGRHEGMYVLLSYLVVFLSAAVLIDTRRKAIFVLSGLAVSAAVVGIVGLLQFLGKDPLGSETFMRALVVPENYYRLAHVKVRALTGQVSSTLYNPNYLGMYMAMVLPVALSLLAAGRTVTERAAWGALALLAAANLLWSGSRTALVGLLAGAVVLLLLRRRTLGRRGWLVLVGLGLLGTGVGGWPLLAKDLPNLRPSTGQGNYLKEVITEGKTILIRRNLDTLRIVRDSEGWVFEDGRGGQIPLKISRREGRKTITLVAPSYGDYLFFTDGNGTLTIAQPRWGEVPLRFAAAKEGVKFVAPSGRLVDLPAVPKVEVAGLEGALSGRLFIWSRTLPLLTETVFFGRGPGTFALYFPQHDYVGKLLAAGDMARLYDKPHNLYLEIAFSTGLLSLACFLFLVLLYLKEGLRLYRQGNADLLAATGSGVLAAVASYLVTALANDGFVTVAPVFWVLLGLGTAVNRMARLRQ